MERGWEGKGLQDLTTGGAQGAAQLLRAVEREKRSAVALKNLNFVEELENDESAAALKNGVIETAVDITEGVLISTSTNEMDKTESAAVAALKNVESAEALKTICVEVCICSSGEMNGMLEDSKDNEESAVALIKGAAEAANAGGAADVESESQSESWSESQSQNQSQSGNHGAGVRARARAGAGAWPITTISYEG